MHAGVAVHFLQQDVRVPRPGLERDVALVDARLAWHGRAEGLRPEGDALVEVFGKAIDDKIGKTAAMHGESSGVRGSRKGAGNLVAEILWLQKRLRGPYSR